MQLDVLPASANYRCGTRGKGCGICRRRGINARNLHRAPGGSPETSQVRLHCLGLTTNQQALIVVCHYHRFGLKHCWRFPKSFSAHSVPPVVFRSVCKGTDTAQGLVTEARMLASVDPVSVTGRLLTTVQT